MVVAAHNAPAASVHLTDANNNAITCHASTRADPLGACVAARPGGPEQQPIAGAPRGNRAPG